MRAEGNFVLSHFLVCSSGFETTHKFFPSLVFLRAASCSLGTILFTGEASFIENVL